ncbi:hypothetical protein [Chryseobacterium gambrini]|uniref:hypothetical protein n=2 Tax=Chryseobacterium TaxID=59732 RepID=UPI003BA58984
MKNYFLIIFITIASNFSFAQTKEEIISRIIKVNSLDDWDGILNPKLDINGLSDNNNYYNFEKLKKISSQNQIFELSKHKNPIVRLYAIGELISQNNHSLDLKKIVLDAISNKEIIPTSSGCIIDRDLTYSIIYHNYWNHVRANSSKQQYEEDNKNNEVMYLQAINNDHLLKEINIEILRRDEDLFWLIYKRAFEIEKYNKNLKKNIIHLLYKYNNSYAFEYLEKNYPKDFKNIYNGYFNKHFTNAKFDNVNQIFYLFNLTKYAFENHNKDMKIRILEKLRTTDNWKKELSGIFKVQIFEKYNVKL